MAKISVSLSDDLKARLDAHAQEHNETVSDVVQKALESYLDGSTPPPAEDDQAGPQIRELQQYVAQLAKNHEQVRASMQLISQMSAPQGVYIPCPPPLGPPPWEKG